LIEIGSKTAEKNSAQTTDRHYENNGHLAMNQKSWYSFYHPMEGGRLSWPGCCSLCTRLYIAVAVMINTLSTHTTSLK